MVVMEPLEGLSMKVDLCLPSKPEWMEHRDDRLLRFHHHAAADLDSWLGNQLLVCTSVGVGCEQSAGLTWFSEVD